MKFDGALSVGASITCMLHCHYFHLTVNVASLPACHLTATSLSACCLTVTKVSMPVWGHHWQWPRFHCQSGVITDSDQSFIASLASSLSDQGFIASLESSLTVTKAVGRWFPPGTPVSSTRKLISSSSFHRLDTTLAVATALNPNKPNLYLFHFYFITSIT